MSIIEKAVNKLEKKSAVTLAEPDLPVLSDVEDVEEISITSDSPSQNSSVEVHATTQSEPGLRETINIPFEHLKSLGMSHLICPEAELQKSTELSSVLC